VYQYAALIHAPAGEVVSHALDYVFSTVAEKTEFSTAEPSAQKWRRPSFPNWSRWLLDGAKT
jgi:hypothetical protein